MYESTPTTCVNNQDAIILKDAPIDIFSLENSRELYNNDKKKPPKSHLEVY